MGCGGSKEALATSPSNGQQPDRSQPAGGSAAAAAAAAPAAAKPAQASVSDSKKEVTKKAGRVKMGNVFATPLEVLGVKDGYKIPIHPKSQEEAAFVKKAAKEIFIFEHLTKKELNKLADAFEKHTITEKGNEVIKQGDVGDYFYILYDGTVEFVVNNNVVGSTSESGKSFGELALMYTCPRAATVRTVSEKTDLFRVDQATFRYILQAQTKEAEGEKTELLKMVSFLTDLNPSQINKLAAVMTPKKFSAGDFLMRKGDPADFFYILSEGKVTAKNIGVGDAKFMDITMEKKGDYFGERALVTGEPRAADIVAESDTTAFAIDKETFETVLGKLNDLILRAQDKRTLSGIKLIQDSDFSDASLSRLAALMKDKKFEKGQFICENGNNTSPALYIVREGEIEISEKETRKIGVGGYFGDDQLLADFTNKKKKKDGKDDDYPAGTPAVFKPSYTVSVLENCVVGVLSLESLRKVFDTRTMGTKEAGASADSDGETGMLNSKIKLDDLKRHTILGQGTFGQVWLVSCKIGGKERPFALKVQSKYELVKDGQAQAVAYEKAIMCKLRHPFLLPLVNTYKDKDFVYMLLGLVQGGELYSYIHTPQGDGMIEPEARFYAAGIAEALAYMHKRGFVYRDLKPENVLIDASGYPCIIDFGFAKFLKDKTYTLCGTPLYLPPEVILNRGHDWSCDHWSLGVLIFEMLFGDTPFYQDGMQQMDLFRAIVKGKFIIPERNTHDEPITPNVIRIMKGFLNKDPAQRLGSLAEGEDGILEHIWFTKPIQGYGDHTIEFRELRRKQVEAPVIPKIKDPLDVSNFEDWSHLGDKTLTRFPKLTPEQEKIFDSF